MTRADWGSTDLGGTIGTLHAGAKLRVAHWPGAADGPGTVVVVQGRGEFIEMYGETIADLTGRGFAVIAFDFRGQGGSERRVRTGGHVVSYRQYVEDLCAVVRHAGQIGLPKPYTILAHSMGGLVATLATPLLARDVDRIVSLAPLFKIARLPLPQGLASAASRIGAFVGLSRTLVTKTRPRPTVEGFAGNPLTSDPVRYAAVCRAFADNPDLTIGAPTFGWLAATFQAMAQARRMADGVLAVPTLFIACGGDRVVSPVAIDSFARKAKGGGLVILRGAKHQALLERDAIRALFFAAFDAFVPAAAPAGKRPKPRRTPGRPMKFVAASTGAARPPQTLDVAEAPAATPPEATDAPVEVVHVEPAPTPPEPGEEPGRRRQLRERLRSGRDATKPRSRWRREKTGETPPAAGDPPQAQTSEPPDTAAPHPGDDAASPLNGAEVQRVAAAARTRLAPRRPLKRGRGSASPARNR